MTSHYRWGLICGLLAVGCWSGFILVTRQGGLSTLTPYDVMALRYSVGGLLLAPFLARWALVTGKGLLLALIGGLGYGTAVYQGFRLTSAMHGAVLLTGAIPFGAALFSAWLLGDRPTLLRWIGLALIGVGAGLMLTESGSGSHWQGDLWLLVAVASWALYTVLIKRWQIPAMSGAVTVAWGSLVIYLPLYLLVLPKQLAMASWHDIVLQALYQGVIATVVAMLLYLRAVASMGPAAMGALMALVPVISGVLAVPVLNETLTLQAGLALLLASAGALLASGLIARGSHTQSATQP